MLPVLICMSYPSQKCQKSGNKLLHKQWTGKHLPRITRLVREVIKYFPIIRYILCKTESNEKLKHNEIQEQAYPTFSSITTSISCRKRQNNKPLHLCALVRKRKRAINM